MAATTTANGTAEEVFIDSLPYFDNDLATHPNLQALVDAEIARELKSHPVPDPSNHPRLQPLLPPFQVRPPTIPSRAAFSNYDMSHEPHAFVTRRARQHAATAPDRILPSTG